MDSYHRVYKGDFHYVVSFVCELTRHVEVSCILGVN